MKQLIWSLIGFAGLLMKRSSHIDVFPPILQMPLPYYNYVSKHVS